MPIGKNGYFKCKLNKEKSRLFFKNKITDNNIYLVYDILALKITSL